MNPDFRDMLSTFNAEGVEYLLVGAYALAAHGVPRATGDIDLWVRPAPANARRVWRAFGAIWAPVSDLRVEELTTLGLIFQIGIAPRRIDVLTAIDGVAFDEAWADRLEILVEGLHVPVISRHHLIRNKRASGRPKDLADLALLDEIAGTKSEE